MIIIPKKCNEIAIIIFSWPPQLATRTVGAFAVVAAPALLHCFDDSRCAVKWMIVVEEG